MSFTPGLTDTQIRATPLPVSGTVTASISGTVTTTGGLTDTQLRASAVPVSLASTTITGSVAVTGTFWQATQPVSAASLPLPAGAATVAKQPAIGTAGTASADVISVQGVAGGTAQPVSGTFYQATQPVSGPITDAQLRAAVVPVSLTSTTITGSVAVTGAFYQATQPVSIAAQVSTINNDMSGVGSLTARDAVVAAPGGAGAAVSGTPTAGSAAFLASANGYGSVNVTITGPWTGTLYFEASENSTNGSDGDWINLNFRQTGIVNTVLSGNTTTNGLFRGNISGYTYFRVRSAGASHTGTATLALRLSSAVGAIFLNASIPGGTNNIGFVTPATPTTFNINSAATTNATSIKASAGTVHTVTASNGGAAAAFVKLFNLAVAPTVGTSVPILTIPIPASSVLNLPMANLGHRFSTGIALSITNLVADTDATAVAASQVKAMVSYL